MVDNITRLYKDIYEKDRQMEPTFKRLTLIINDFCLPGRCLEVQCDVRICSFVVHKIYYFILAPSSNALCNQF